MPRFRIRRLVAALFLLLTIPAHHALAAEAGPSEAVGKLNATILEVMRNAKTLGYQGRYDKLSPVLTETFNFPLMAGISAGRHWSKLSREQKAALREAFARQSIGTFANRFDGYSGERFEIAGEEPGPRGSVLVRNKLIKSNGEAVEINYLMKEYDGRWRAVDVYLDSKYSELAVKRSENTSIIANEGFDTLIERIEAKLAEWSQ